MEFDELIEKFNRDRFAIVTAYRLDEDGNDQYEASNSKERFRELKIRLNARGLDYVEVSGYFPPYPVEPALVIFDISERAAIELGFDYRQDSIIYGDSGNIRLVSTSGDDVGSTITAFDDVIEDESEVGYSEYRGDKFAFV